MDDDRTCDCAYANRQWKKDRELMILRHLSTTTGSERYSYQSNAS
jgi:hypothetical protein